MNIFNNKEDYNSSVTLNDEEEYDTFVKKLEGYDYWNCSFDSPNEYPAILHYSEETDPYSFGAVYKGEYEYPENEIKEQVEFLMSFLYHLDNKSIYIHEETNTLTSEYPEFGCVEYKELREIAESWIKKQK